MEPLPRGVFALLNLWVVPEVVVVALGLVGTLPELEMAFHTPPLSLCGAMHMLPTRLTASTWQGLSTFCFHHPASSGVQPCLLAWQVSHCLTLRHSSCSM